MTRLSRLSRLGNGGSTSTAFGELLGSLRFDCLRGWVGDHQSQPWSLAADRSHRIHKFLEDFPLHRGAVAVVVDKNIFAAELAGHDTPSAAENLKLFFCLYTNANFEALHRLKRIVNISNWVIATNDNDGPAQCLDRWQPDDCLGASLLLPKQFFCVDPPQPIVADDLGALVVAGKPSSALGAVRKCKGDGIGIVLVSNDLRSNKSP
jgi:hypothetical protein